QLLANAAIAASRVASSRASVCGLRGSRRPASTAMTGLPARGGSALSLERSRRAPALWRSGKVQLDRLAASARARLDGELSGAGLQNRAAIFSAQLMQTPALSIPQPVQLQLCL